MVYEIKQSRPAPQNLNGTLYWLKENLFATIFDTILTLSVILFLWWVVPMFLDWAVFNASFSGTTKADVIGSGANWIFIKKKFNMFIYGFYPQEQIYRVNIVFGLFFVTVGLFKFVAKSFTQKSIVFLIYPVVSFILIKGGYFGLPDVPTDKWGGLLLLWLSHLLG
jgi:general L-amino acid transport system permease protein